MQPNDPQQANNPNEPALSSAPEPVVIRPASASDQPEQNPSAETLPEQPQSPVQATETSPQVSPQPANAMPTQANPEPTPAVDASQTAQVSTEPSVAPAMNQNMSQPMQSMPAPQGMPAMPSNNGAGKSKKPLLIGMVAAGVLLVLGSLGFVFGYYLPNTPDNVWATGVSRTGDEVQAVVDKLADPSTFDSLAKSQLVIAGEGTFDKDTYTLGLDSKYDQKNTDSTLDFSRSSKGSSNTMDIAIKAKTQVVENSVWPNIYFQISGISSLGLDFFLPGIEEYEDKWIAVEQDFYGDTLSQVSGADSEEASNITQQDVVSIMNDVVTISQDYVFTTDPENAVIMMDEFVGNEQSEGITAYHYKASANLDNASKFCKAVATQLISNNEAYRKINKITEENQSEKVQEAEESCTYSDEQKEELEKDNPFDIWMDKKHKIFHKVRFYENLEERNAKYREQKSECQERIGSSELQGASADNFCSYYDDLINEGEQYTEVGQIYDGNDTMQLFFNQISDTTNRKDAYKTALNIDVNTLRFNGDITYENTTESERTMNAKVTIKTEPYDGEIDSARPADAIDLQTVLDRLQSSSRQDYLRQELGLNTDGDLPENDSSVQDALNVNGLQKELRSFFLF